MPADPIVVRALSSLGATDRARVVTLVKAARDADGVRPVNDQAWLDLHGAARDGIAHQLAEVGDTLVGYAHLDSSTDEPTGQLVVHPGHRRRGVATTMLRELGFDPRCGEGAGRLARGLVLQMWSFGNLPAARASAAALAYAPTRTLLIMERDLTDLDEPVWPTGYAVRPFCADDIPGWLRVNSRAFAHHPEQGQMTEADVRARMAEPWFDPEGFLIAVTAAPGGGEEIVGFHWTKIHEDGTGEVYVIAVDPDYAGAGLGRQLLAAGMLHLRDSGVRRVILYVEADQERVVRMYDSARFTVAHTDVLHAPAAPALG